MLSKGGSEFIEVDRQRTTANRYVVYNVYEDGRSHGNNSISVAAEVLGNIIGPYQVDYQEISNNTKRYPVIGGKN